MVAVFEAGIEASRARLSARGIAELDQDQEPTASRHDAGHEGDRVGDVSDRQHLAYFTKFV
jgi:hypothetical protein